MSVFSLLLAALALGSPEPPVPASAGTLAVAPADESSFLRGLQAVRDLVALGRWESAGRSLDGLLARHERATYALPYLAEIVELYERSAFFAAHPPPNPAALIDGELLHWDPASGRIRLRYRDLDSSDFEHSAGGAIVHPLEFTGPYELKLEGKFASRVAATDSPAALQALVCVARDRSHQVIFGYPRFESGNAERWIPPKLVENAEASRVLDEKPQLPLALGTRYRFDVSVGAERIEARVGGKRLLEGAKPPGLFGRVAFFELEGLTSVELSGIAHAAWLRGLVDAAQSAARAEFQKTWAPAERIPAWVLESVVTRSRATPTISFSRNVKNSQLDTLDRLQELYVRDEHAEGLRETQRLRESDLAPELNEFFRALFLLKLARGEEALAAATRASQVAPDFVEARAIRGRALAELGRESEALTELRKLVSEEPQVPLPWSECARWLLRFGHASDAKTVVDRALVIGIPADALGDVTSLLARALSGPVWSTTHEYASRHYHVKSDLSRQACFEASRVLEEARRLYERKLGPLLRGKRPSGERAAVYVFSGRAGYDAYAGDLFGLAPERTGGVFSPQVQQLLVWSPADRANLDRILRHEGLHQFLDAAIRDVPVWLNEGLAEYFEGVELVRGAPVEGAPIEAHVELLANPGTRWIPFEQLFARTPTEFYDDAEIHYAQSWALVHWMLEAGLAPGRLFQGTLADLGTGRIDALRERLLSTANLELEVREHVAALAQK